MIWERISNSTAFAHAGISVYIAAAIIFNLTVCYYCIFMNTFVLIRTNAEGCFNAANFKALSADLWGFP